MNLFKGCDAILSWQCQSGTQHTHSWTGACTDSLERTRGRRKIVPGVKSILSETKSKLKGWLCATGSYTATGCQQDASYMWNKDAAFNPIRSPSSQYTGRNAPQYFFAAKLMLSLPHTAGFYFVFSLQVTQPKWSLLAPQNFVWRRKRLEG